MLETDLATYVIEIEVNKEFNKVMAQSEYEGESVTPQQLEKAYCYCYENTIDRLTQCN